MACCTSLPYFMTTDTQQYSAVNGRDSDDVLMYDSEDDDTSLCGRLLTAAAAAAVSNWPADGHHKNTSESFSAIYSDVSPLLNDCMWSAGMLPPDLKAATPPARRSQDCVTSLSAVEDKDVNTDTAVDPSLISPCPHLTSSPGARHVTDPGTLIT